MKKYVQSAWMRVLSCMLCTVSSIGLVISVLGFWVFAQMGGAYEIYSAVKEEIAETYALYAVDEVENGNTEELAEYFKERGIACSIVYVPNSEISENEVTANEDPLFSMEVDKEAAYLIEMVPGTTIRYDEDSLLSVLMGYTTHDSVETHVEFPIELMVFDSSTGLFYYKTEVGYFEVENIWISEAGVRTDYILTKVDGQKCYYNSYFGTKLDTSQYEMWSDVIIDGSKLSFSDTPEELSDGILIVSDINAFETPIRDTYHETNGFTLICEYEDYMDKYQILIDWDVVGHSEKLMEDSLFYQWENLFGMIYGFEENIIICIVISFILLSISGALLIYSAISEKEKLGFLYKVPLCTYSGVMLIIESLLLILLGEGIIEGLIYNNMGSLENVLLLAVLVVVVMVWLAFIYLQNIITRFKTRTFIRYSEFYYAYKILKWMWIRVTKPFKAFFEMVRDHTPLVIRVLVILAVFSFVEFFIMVICWWNMDAYVWFFLLIKAVEIVLAIAVTAQMQKLQEGSKRIAAGDLSEPIDTSKMFWEFKKHGENINKVSDGIALAVDERMKSERFKTELITNVSHDIKTPLTSIINYVDLIKKEDITDETLKEYVDVLDRQSARLKKLIEDLMEASKASTGNLAVNMEDCDVEVLLTQLIGEFEEKLSANQLEVVVQKPDHPVMVSADGRHMWRVLDNLLNNACKYSLPGTRVYVSLVQENNIATITFKNISKAALNIPSDELMERFVRGDSSRNTEGSGLGLSIAQSLTELMKGTMKLDIDGDLFKVTLKFQAGASKENNS